MKSEKQIRGMVRELLTEALRKRYEETRKRLPHRCTHNLRHPLDYERLVDGATNDNYNRIGSKSLPMAKTIGLCMLGASNVEEWPGNICEDPIDAQRCPYFTPSMNEEQVLTEFQAQLQDPTWLQENLPAVSTFMWVLEQQSSFKLPWWSKLWRRIRRPKLEPVVRTPPILEVLFPEKTDVSS